MTNLYDRYQACLRSSLCKFPPLQLAGISRNARTSGTRARGVAAGHLGLRKSRLNSKVHSLSHTLSSQKPQLTGSFEDEPFSSDARPLSFQPCASLEKSLLIQSNRIMRRGALENLVFLARYSKRGVAAHILCT